MRIFVVILCLLMSANTALGQITADKPNNLLPVEFCRGYVIVQVTLQSEAASLSAAERTLDFIYDTGAARSYVDPDSIRRVSGVTVKSGQRAIIRNASAGPVTFKKLPARVKEMDAFSGALGRRIDGILAYGAFKDVLLTIDYPNAEVSIASYAPLPKPDNRAVFSTRHTWRDRRPYLDVHFADDTRRMLIDSGAGTSFGLRNLGKYATTANPVVLRQSLRINRYEDIRGARLSDDARIGAFTFVEPIVEEYEKTELIGYDVLKHFSWTFDQKKRRVLIRKGNSQDITFDSVTNIGAKMRAVEGGIRIDEIIKNGAADRASLLAGDLISNINGEPVLTRGCKSLNDEMSTSSYTIVRNGTRFDIAIDALQVIE